jgi:uncharacterized protein
MRHVIDIHAHTSLSDESLSERLVADAARLGIRTICDLGDVFAFGEWPTEDQVAAINDETIASVARFPDSFVGFLHLNPEHGERFLIAEIDRCILGGGLRGIKLEVSVNSRDGRLDPIMRRAEELDIPLLHHAWYKTVQKTRCESDPSDIADLASRFPRVTIVMAHLTGGAERGVQDVKPFPNVLIDTSGSQPVSGLVEYGVRELGADRIVFGSDVPGRDFAVQLGRVLGAAISEEEREKVLRLNAERILKLGKESSAA